MSFVLFSPFAGRNCDVDFDDCASVPCLNHGLCQDKMADYECFCRHGYTGRNCEIHVEDERYIGCVMQKGP